MDLRNTGTYTGNCAYAFELASAHLSCRLMAAKNVNYNLITGVMLGVIGLHYYMFSASYLFVVTV